MTSPTTLDDIESVGNAHSWHEFEEAYFGRVLGWLLKHVIRYQDAEDVAQEVMCLVTVEVSRFARNARCRNWLRRVMANRLRKHWRKSRRLSEASDQFDNLSKKLVDDRMHISQAFDKKHDNFVIDRMLTSIKGRFRDASLPAFRQIALEQRPAEEVGKTAGYDRWSRPRCAVPGPTANTRIEWRPGTGQQIERCSEAKGATLPVRRGQTSGNTVANQCRVCFQSWNAELGSTSTSLQSGIRCPQLRDWL